MLELTSKTSCAYAPKTCYRFPFYVKTDKGMYNFKCETNLQRYRWIYAIRLASEGKPPEPPPRLVPSKPPAKSKATKKKESSAHSVDYPRRRPSLHNLNGNAVRIREPPRANGHAVGISLEDFEDHQDDDNDDVTDEDPLGHSSYAVSVRNYDHALVATNKVAAEHPEQEALGACAIGYQSAASPNGKTPIKGIIKYPKTEPRYEPLTNRTDSFNVPSTASTGLSSENDLEIMDLDDDDSFVVPSPRFESPKGIYKHRKSIQFEDEVFPNRNILKVEDASKEQSHRLSLGDMADRGTIVTDMFGSRRTVWTDSRGHRRSYFGGEKPSIGAFHTARNQEFGKSQSWTNLSFARLTPPDTQQRRENSAPPLRQARHEMERLTISTS